PDALPILSAWRGFYAWWAPRAGLAANPAESVKAPKAARSLPKALSVDQPQSLLHRSGLPPPTNAIEWRDQAMFEVLYSSGLRLAELVSRGVRRARTQGHHTRSWLELEAGGATVRGSGG